EVLQDALIRRSNGMDSRSHWSMGRTYMQRLDMWAWAFTQDVRIAAVGMLALFTAPLAWGLFLYHFYLAWAGMTTNESFKWDEWKEDIADGYVFRVGPASPGLEAVQDVELQPRVLWPKSSTQQLVNKLQTPHWSLENDLDLQRRGAVRVQSLQDIDNIYDLGFLNNIKDILGIYYARIGSV
ncbi:palmitoyltransferase swf1, partial [Ptychographa xylographoides]|nr:palmitoyltransferase swf1 [Ptychographa xylographoides]